MKAPCAIFAVTVYLAAGITTGRASDMVRKTTGTVVGRVMSMSGLEVEVEQTNKTRTRIPVNEILTIYYDEDPSSLRTVRSHVTRGAYQDALDALKKVKADEVTRKEIKQDLAFYEALCAARLALEGSGTIREAGAKIRAFAVGHTESYHYLEACEVVGDLYLAVGAYAQAEQFYRRLAAAPWPDSKMRAGVAIGRARLALGKTDQALEAFEGVLAIEATGGPQQVLRTAATLGKARCLAADGKPDEAIQMVHAVLADLAKAESEQVELHARAYNTLGTALREADRTKDALMAFLHVDVLYFAVPDAHAEALANLAELWNEVHKTQRAIRARRILEEQYGDSRWAQ